MKTILSLVLMILAASIQAQARVVIIKDKGSDQLIEKRTSKDMRNITYLNDEKTPFTGTVIQYDRFGKKSSRQFYNKGLIHGKDTSWNYRGDSAFVKSVCTYSLGKMCGERTEWYSPGRRSALYNYDAKGESHGVWVSFKQYTNEDTNSVRRYDHGKLLYERINR